MHTDMKALTTNPEDQKYYLLGIAVLDKARELELLDPIDIQLDHEQMTIVWCNFDGEEMRVTIRDGKIKWEYEGLRCSGIDLDDDFEKLLQAVFPNPHLYI